MTTRIVVPVIRAVTRLATLCGVDVGTQIAPLMASRRPPSFVTRGLTLTQTTFKGWRVQEITGPNRSANRVIAIHGGSFVVQPTVLHWLDYAQIARRTDATVLVPMYPLAGDVGGNAATVVPAMADFIASNVGRHGTRKVSVYGDSAGATIALAAAQELVRRGDEAIAPSQLVLLSPALDVTYSNPGIAAVRDPVLNIRTLRSTALQWAAGLDLDDPMVSPINGRLQGLPPIAIYYGSLEFMAPDIRKLQEAVSALGGASERFTFVRGEGRIHDWAQGGLPGNADARAVRHDIFRLLGLLPDQS